MKILYLQNIRLPTEKAHGLQVMETCHSLAFVGHEVSLVIGSYLSLDENAIFGSYNIEKNFSLKKVPVSFGRQNPEYTGFLMKSIIYVYNAWKSYGKSSFDIVYTRDTLTAVVFSVFGKKVFYEIHDVRHSLLQRLALKRAIGVVSITRGLVDYCESIGIKKEKVCIAPDAVDLVEFQIKDTKSECRAKLGLPQNKKIVLYTGHLYSWKGADTLAQSAQFLDENTVVTFVGGHDYDIEVFKKRFADARISVLGRKSHDLMPYYMKAADVLVLPNSAKEDISRLYTSPIKLFEYMASGQPIVASDLPSLREVLNEKNCTFFAPDDASSLADSIKKILANQESVDIRAKQALIDVQEYTWQKRAQKIIDFIKTIKHD
ncbi:MAG: glycosyltransferase family 4 protein [Candidatus Pacebacteria bacterium]|nr:glycosyltransferase family 4 protein [Candidatus Paceibacterota bacterium]